MIYAILDAAENDANDLASKLDINGNSPLQLACRDVKLWRKDPSSTSTVIGSPMPPYSGSAEVEIHPPDAIAP